MIGELNAYTTGWVTYFHHAQCKSQMQDLDKWIRRRLRCLRLKQCKRPKAIADLLQRLGVPKDRAWSLAPTGKGWWRKSRLAPANEAMSLDWFKDQGLISLSERYLALQTEGNRRGT